MNPAVTSNLFPKTYRGAQGLAEDVRYYGQWMRDEAEKRIGRLYPKVKITAAMAADRPDLKPLIGQELTVIAWLWARTVPSPNPALGGAPVPLVRSFWLSTKKSKEAWVEPVMDAKGRGYRFEVRTGTPTAAEKKAIDAGTKTGRGCKFRCLLSDTPIPEEHIKSGARAGDMGARLMAIVAEGERGRVYLSPTDEQEATAQKAAPGDTIGAIHAPLANDPRNLWCLAYGLDHFDKLFTPRQLVALTTFSDLVMEAREKVLADARAVAGGPESGSAERPSTLGVPRQWAGAERQRDGAERERAGAARAGDAAQRRGDETSRRMDAAARRVDGAERRMDETPRSVDAAQRRMDAAERQSAEIAPPDPADPAVSYADAVATYLAFAVDRSADFWCSLCAWANQPKNEIVAHVFGRQALPMVWDYAEASPFSESGGNFTGNLNYVAKALLGTAQNAVPGESRQVDAALTARRGSGILVSTDPPYYDNIGYADLSDFFYVWMRRSLSTVYPDLFRTLLTPKAEELIATPYRHDGSKAAACQFFESGLGRAFDRMREVEHPEYPLSVFYAFKQAEDDDGDDGADSEGAGTASTGWETMLEGLLNAGFAISGTWPMRTERETGLKGMTNALASSIVLVCHPRAADAAMTTRKDFVAALKKELPAALRDLQSGNIAPVDLAQAAIGPGMAIYSRYSKVVNSDGSRMPVRTALQLINQALDEVLSEQESEFDSETRWAIKWFEQHAHDEGAFGDAETLSKAMAVSVRGLREAGLVKDGQGKVRLLRREELAADWDPATDKRLTIWEVTQYLIRRLESGGDAAAAELLRKVGSLGEVARDLAYRLYSTCERKKWPAEARSYNGLVVAWAEIGRISREAKAPAAGQREMAFE